MFKRFVCEFVNVKRVKSIKDDELTNETCAYKWKYAKLRKYAKRQKFIYFAFFSSIFLCVGEGGGPGLLYLQFSDMYMY